MDSEKSCRCRPTILAPKTVELKEGGLLRGSERSPHKQLLFNLILNGPKPLFGADGSVSPVLNLSHHLMCSIFGCSEFHGKLVCKTHSAIAVFFREAGRRSDLRNDGLPRVVERSNSSLMLLFGCKFEHLFRCVRGTLIYH